MKLPFAQIDAFADRAFAGGQQAGGEQVIESSGRRRAGVRTGTGGQSAGDQVAGQ